MKSFVLVALLIIAAVFNVLPVLNDRDERNEIIGSWDIYDILICIVDILVLAGGICIFIFWKE